MLISLCLLCLVGQVLSLSSCPQWYNIPPTDLDKSCQEYSRHKLSTVEGRMNEVSEEVDRLQRTCGRREPAEQANQNTTFLQQTPTRVIVSHSDCQHVARLRAGPSGVYNITAVRSTQQLITVQTVDVDNSEDQHFLAVTTYEPKQMFCHIEGDQGWTVIMRRKFGNVSFNRTWHQYKTGFGSLEGDFWMGLDSLNRITSQPFSSYTLWVVITDTQGIPHVFPYTTFKVGDDSTLYKLRLSGYVGKLDDPFLRSNGMTFQCANSTQPRRSYDYYDSRSDDCSRAANVGCWWFYMVSRRTCGINNLNAATNPYWKPLSSSTNQISSVEMRIKNSGS